MSLSEIINTLKLNNVTLKLQGEQLKLIGETASLTKELIAEIKRNKASLISFLKETNNSLNFQPIPISPRALHYSLTGAQKQIWIACQFAGGAAAYTIVSSFYLKGIDVQLLQAAFKQLIQRHESLRTIFKEVEGEPRQFILDEIDFAIEHVDFKNVKNKAQKIAEEESRLQHNSCLLEHGPLIKVKLVELSETEHALLLSMHHIISDGWSIGILMQELMTSYGATNELITAYPPLNIQYKDYANWLTEKQARHHYAKESSYWKERLRHLPEPLSIPSDFVRPDVKKQEGAISRFYLKAEQYQVMQLLCKKLSISLFNFLHAATGIFLYKYTGQCRTIIGTAVSGRQHAELENQLGLYVNTLALLTETDPEKSIVDCLKETAAAATRDFQHQSYPFDQLVDTLMIKREAGRTPLFDVMLVLQNTAIAERSIRIGKENNIEIAFLDKHFYKNKSLTKLNRAAKFDLTFDFLVEGKDTLRVELEYSTELFTEARICKLGNMFTHILSQMLKYPKKKINELELLNAPARRKLLHQFNEPIKEINDWQLADLLKPSFQKYKGKTVIIYGKNEFSYKTIDEYSNQLAYYLTSKLPTAGNSLVGVFMERSEWVLISILGILKAGATYVPIDINYPEARVKFMLEDANPEFILADKKGKGNVPGNFRERVIDLTTEKETILSFPKQLIYPRDLREKTAYLIYTSGSTGKPKGVEICHRNVIAFLQWAREEFVNTPFDLLYATTSYCFDLSLFEFFFPLLTGKTIRLLNSAMEIVHFLPGDKRVMLNTVPSVVRNLLEEKIDLSSVSAMNMAGEAVPKKFKQVLPYSRIEVRNLYGPSEDTTYSTCYLFKEDGYDEIPIGKPISNTQLYILDAYLHLLPEGVDGEIYLSGQGIAKGYHGLPELTKEKFLNNPFIDGQLLYKTGDIGRWLPDGQVLFTGRVDDQVKVRGYRIELGEIQFQLEQIAGIEHAVVVVKEIQGDNHIIAYWRGNNEISEGELKEVLVSQLPVYSLPSFFIRLENIPLNANGKVDKKMLPLPNELTPSIANVRPENELEESLHVLWKQVLPTDSFGVTNSFFELGGNSLNTTRLKILIHKELKKAITLQQLFQHPTIRQQAELLHGKEESNGAAIEKASSSPFYPLSSTQQRLWVISQFAEGNKAYNMPGVYLMEGKLDVDALAEAFDTVVERHEILRTVFKENAAGEVQQFILSPAEIQFELKQVDLQQEDSKEDVVKIEVVKQIEECFDLSKGPLIRATVYQLSSNQWVFAYVMHHIISDGWSMGIIINEVSELYNSYVEQRIPSLSSLEIQFKDYTNWEQKQLTGEQLMQHKHYWLQQFEGEIPVLNFSDKKRPSIKTYNGAIYKTRLDSKLTKKLKAFFQEKDGTLFIGLLSMVNAILYRYTNQEDIIIGMPVAGRDQQQLENQIGCYVNTLALRNSVKGEENFNVLFENTKQQALQAYEHQAYPFEEMLNAISLPHDLSRNALFDVMVSLEDDSLNDRIKELKGLSISKYESDLKINSKFDLFFDFKDSKEDIQLNTEYNTDVFSETFIHSFIQNFLRLVELLLDKPTTAIGQLDFLSHEERQTLLIDFNNTAVEYPKDKTLIDLFEEQVAKTPDQVALVFDNANLTYKTLNDLSNQLGDYLRKNYKIKPDDLVGIKLERSEWIVIAILGVLKSGAAYVPIDPVYPENLIQYMISDSQCCLLIDEEELERFKQEQDKYGRANRKSVAKMNNLAYVIYTSGSTGQPKGVMIEHRSLTAFIYWCRHEFSNSNFESVLAATSVCFDLSIFEIFFTLSTGKKIHLLANAMAISAHLNHKENILLNTVPSVVGSLLNEGVDFSSVKVLNMAGEPIPQSYITALDNEQMEIRNLYGPTEDTTYSSVYRIKDDAAILIGRPIGNTQFYILNDQLQLQPKGVMGEIYIGGDGLARGYFAKSELTSERFIPSPFQSGQRIYKTGDLGKWLLDGNIELAGRKDDQVKIRGYRIETKEIESVILEYKAIDAVVVIAKDDMNGYKILVAYIVSDDALNVSDIRSYLGKRLPVYMIPSYFMQLEEIPLTPNGKIDKNKLPDPSSSMISYSMEYVAPRNETEEKLVIMWQEILGKDKIGVKDNFFELGGHSLKMNYLINQARKKFKVELSFRDVFNAAILEEQARLIESSNKVISSSISKAPLQSHYSLSSAQKRVYFLQEFAPESISYNMPLVQYVGEKADKSKIEKILIELIQRHESFRTSFEKIDGIVKQKIHDHVTFVLDEHFCLMQDLDIFINSYIRPFDLTQAPLLRSSLVNIKGLGFVWIADMHHIISDGTSLHVLANDFISLYHGTELLDLKLQYKDFSEWQNACMLSPAIEKQKKYWMDQFKDGIPLLNLPCDRSRPAVFSFEGGYYSFSLDRTITKKLNEFIRLQQGSLQMTLVTVLNILFYKYCNQEDIIIGTGIAGRRHHDVENIVGMFVNSLAIRSFPSGDKSFIDFYAEVASSCLAAYENQDIQFEDLLELLKVNRDPSRNPVFDVSLIVQNFQRTAFSLSDLLNTNDSKPLSVIQYQPSTSKFDMDWLVEEINDEIVIKIEYYSAIYDRSTIERFSNHFQRILNIVLDSPTIQLSNICMLTAEESKYILDNYASGVKQAVLTDQTIHSAIENQASIFADEIAIEDNTDKCNYRELNERSNQLGNFLYEELHLALESRVGILQSKSINLLISILSVIKAGGAYVPLDSEYPEDRLLYMLEDLAIEVLITEKNFVELANKLQWRCSGLKHVICIDSDNYYQEKGAIKSDLMRKDLWDHIGDVANDSIGQGGWINSYSGEDFTELEMLEYSKNVYQKLYPYLHKGLKVLEIGCSSGLTMFQIAPEVGAYYGTDLSSTILKKTQQQVDEKGYDNIFLFCMPAHEIDQVQENDFDLIIINSVIQCFNGHNYLRDVIMKTIQKMKTSGILFIGDIMDEDMRVEMIKEFNDYKKNNQILGQHTKTNWSIELFVSKKYFDDLVADNIGITRVNYSKKIHSVENELTKFRYDALLEINKCQSSAHKIERTKYQYCLNEIGKHSTHHVKSKVTSDNLVYVFYTSGTTGQPKGVMVEHGSLIIRLEGERQLLGTSAKMITCMTTNFCFDVSLLETIFPLLFGGKIIIPSKEKLMSPDKMIGELIDRKVTLLQGTPSFIKGVLLEAHIPPNKLSLTHLSIGGESLYGSLVKELQDKLPGTKINNHYGPTESVIDAIVYENVKVFTRNIIGRPIPNVRAYIMDDSLNLSPMGAIGEIGISGESIARGYINQEDYTKQKFIPSPFNAGERIYKTGDLGRWLPDGNIEFIGRNDRQVKIRGHRIELNEIETAILQYKGIETAYINTISNQNKEIELVAYLVTKLNIATDLRKYLVHKLPVYMVPTYFIRIDALPLNSNGKVDRNALPNPKGQEISVNMTGVQPCNEIQEAIANIWREVLEISSVGIKDNFFEVGGHSLRVIRMISKIRSQFGVDIKIADVFSNPTIEFLAKEVEREKWGLQNNNMDNSVKLIVSI